MTQCCCKPSWICGSVDTPAGAVGQISTLWHKQDKRGRIRCRTSNAFRMRYRIDPGLYAVGHPNKTSPVFVSANYKLSFDILRRNCAGIDAWILVLDTKGINVWCAAGKGTFGTDELCRKLRETRLEEIIDHRRIIVPQLGATGVSAPEVQKRTGFRVVFGPVSAADIPAFLANNTQATPGMRQVTFPFSDRLVLTPMEIIPAFQKIWPWALLVVAILGLQPEGILFSHVMTFGLPLAVAGIGAVLAGTLLTPVLLPWIPFRAFSLKGWLAGCAVVAGCLPLFPAGSGTPAMLIRLSALTGLPALSSFLAFNFTGCTTFTSVSGVKKELKIALPFQIAGGCVAIVLLLIFKVFSWRLQ